MQSNIVTTVVWSIAWLLVAATSSGVQSTPLDPIVSDDDLKTLMAKRLPVPVLGIDRLALRDTFNEKRGTQSHEALDIAAPRGTPVVAVEEGRVLKLFTSAAGGLTIYHIDPTGKFAYYYAHLDRYADGLREKQLLKTGQVIGYVGTTGNAPSNAPHLHFAIFRLGAKQNWWEGRPINPLPYLH